MECMASYSCIALPCQSPDGKMVASGSIDGIINLYDLQSGKLLHTWKVRDGDLDAEGCLQTYDLSLRWLDILFTLGCWS